MRIDHFMLRVVTSLTILVSSGSAFAHLHPALGRFVQRDALEYADSLSLSEYNQSRPDISVDPTGMIAGCPWTKPTTGFCPDIYPNPFHPHERCYREIVPIGSGPSGNQCCYNENTGTFTGQSPDAYAPAIGGDNNGCRWDCARVAMHIWCDILEHCPYQGPTPPAPKAPSTGPTTRPPTRPTTGPD